jgi:hypothetical protein
MHAPFGGGAFPGDDAIADDGESLGGGVAAGNFGGFERSVGQLRGSGGHWLGLLLGFLLQASISTRGVNE